MTLFARRRYTLILLGVMMALILDKGKSIFDKDEATQAVVQSHIDKTTAMPAYLGFKEPDPLDGQISRDMPSVLNPKRDLMQEARPVFASDQEFAGMMMGLAEAGKRLRQSEPMKLLSPESFEFTAERLGKLEQSRKRASILDTAALPPKRTPFSTSASRGASGLSQSMKNVVLPNTRKARAEAFRPYAEQIASEEGIHELGRGWDEIWRRQIFQESGWNPQAVSSANARGIGQFIPGTWMDMQKQYEDLRGKSPHDPEAGMRASIRYNKENAARLGTNNPAAILAAYNWGPARVEKYGLRRLPKETQEYLQIILGPKWRSYVNAYEMERMQREQLRR